MKTNQNKHAFHTFEGTLDLGITMIFCGVSWFSSSELFNFMQLPTFATLKFRSSNGLTVVACKKIYFNVFPKTKVISFTYDPG